MTPMPSQLIRRAETHRTFAANVRLHAVVATHVFPQLIGADELLPTNVTRERTTFTVRLQQMRLELITPSEAFRAVSTRVRLCVRVDENVPLQLFAPLEQLPALKTLARSTSKINCNASNLYCGTRKYREINGTVGVKK